MTPPKGCSSARRPPFRLRVHERTGLRQGPGAPEEARQAAVVQEDGSLARAHVAFAHCRDEARHGGDLPGAIAHSEDGLAVLPAGVPGRQHAHLLICLATAAGLAGDEERALPATARWPR